MATDTLESMRLKPFDHFRTPMDVGEHPTLTRDEKLSVLKAMEHDARELAVASEENMDGDAPPMLRDIRRAIRAVDPDGAVDGAGAAKTM